MIGLERELRDDEIVLDDRYHGGIYGIPDQATLDAQARSAPEGVTVVGVGGGTAMDVAKWISWRRDLPLVQLPTLASVDACFTRMSALRDGERVRYDGDAVPDEVLVDYEILAAAPPALLSAGIGDVLSCLTALADWRLAVGKGIDPAWDDDGARASERYVQALADATGKVVEVSCHTEATTVGAGYLAGLAVGVWGSTDDLAALWNPATVVAPTDGFGSDGPQRTATRAIWAEAIRRSRGWIPDLSALDF